MKTYKTIIIDDEPLARQIIEKYLVIYPELEVTDQCSNGFEALKSIQQHQPDLLFLDVQMPKINGFELLELLENPPVIIFVTAYDEYAIKAFELNAVDYLLKPFSKERFQQAVHKALLAINQPLEKKRTGSIPPGDILNRVVVKTGSKIRIIPAEAIDYLEAQDDYVMIYSEGEKFLKQQTLKYYEQHLDNQIFSRIHRSYLVNLERIANLEPWGKSTYQLRLRNGSKLPVSRSGYSLLKERLGI